MKKFPVFYHFPSHLSIVKRPVFFLLTSRKVMKYCFHIFKKHLSGNAKIIPVLVPDGEKGKSLRNAERLWKTFSKHRAEKGDGLVCLGGGSITDLGAFCASTYKRGLQCIHVPTTLLAMVDASIGGKTAVNFYESKNQLGTFFLPEAVIIIPEFLKTLPEAEKKNGMAEMFKIALTSDSHFWQSLCREEYKTNLLRCIRKAIRLKCEIVRSDFYDQGKRKILNFGHTFGHALESLSWKTSTPLSHGMAVTQGMILEIFLSFLYGRMDEIQMMDILDQLNKHLFPAALKADPRKLYQYMQQDKKNQNKKILSIGLEKPGTYCMDLEVGEREVAQCVKMYHAWKTS